MQTPVWKQLYINALGHCQGIGAMSVAIVSFLCSQTFLYIKNYRGSVHAWISMVSRDSECPEETKEACRWSSTSSHWPHHLSCSLRVSSRLLRYLSCVFALCLSHSPLSQSHICFECLTYNCSQQQVNVTSCFPHQRTVQPVAIPKICDVATRAWYAVSKLR